MNQKPMTRSMIVNLYAQTFDIDGCVIFFDDIPTRIRASKHSFSGMVCEVVFAGDKAENSYMPRFKALVEKEVGRTCIARKEDHAFVVSVPFTEAVNKFAEAAQSYFESGFVGKLDDYVCDDICAESLYHTQY